MDRKAWIVITLCVAGLVGWYWTIGQQAMKAATEAPSPTPEAPAAATPAPAATPEPTPTPVPEAPAMAARSESLVAGDGKDRAEFVFNNDAGGIESVILLMHLGENKEAVHLNGDSKMPIGAICADPSTSLGGFEMQANADAGEVVFTKTDADGLRIEKKFTLAAADDKASPYAVDLQITYSNPTDAAISRSGYFLSVGAAAPIHNADQLRYTQFDWDRDGKMKSINPTWFDQPGFLGIKWGSAKSIYSEVAERIQWAAVTSQYFCTIVSAKDAQGSSTWATRFEIPTKDRLVYGMRGAMGMPGFTVEPGNSLTQNFEIYAGPKDMQRLDALGHDEEAVLNFGWFGFVSKFLLTAMNFLHSLVGSYAAAIIILTLCIKTALWPIQNKATNSMRRMSLLSPKMTELREKYKDDPTKMNEELMKLYKDYGVNPFSGCLPMLIQIPIFFGFYTMLGSAIELRNSSFFWIHDLSQPDTIAHVLGFPINVLPLIMAGTMVWQMAITPKTGDPSQQRILMFMPIIFVVFAYNYASALSLYWTTQNLFSIVQLYLTRNRPLPTLEKVSQPATKRAGRGAGKRKKS